MIAAFPYQGRLVSQTAGTGMPAGTITPGTIRWPNGQMPGGTPKPGNAGGGPMAGTGGWPGGYVSPTVGGGYGQRPQATSTGIASTTAGTTMPAGTITPGTINWNLLRKLGILPPEPQQPQAQQGQQPYDFLGLGNFYNPQLGMGDAQNQPPAQAGYATPYYAASGIGGYMPRRV